MSATRVTTNSILRGYRTHLNNSINNLNTARTHVLTQRSYNSAAEDPASAIRGAHLERKYLRNLDNLDMVKDMQSRLDTQEGALMQVSNAATRICKEYSLEALNGPNSGYDERLTFAAAMRQDQEHMVLSMNATYEDSFVFAGADGKNSPFELTTGADGKSQILTYRGINVNTTDPDELRQLEEYANESVFVDMGFSLQTAEVDGVTQIASSSAYDMSMPGIKSLGYGMTGDISNNVITLVGQMAEELEKPDGEFSSERYKELMSQMEKISTNVLNNVTEIGVKSEFLTTTKSRLEDTDVNLQEQLSSVEGIDMAEAITTYAWSQYAYNAALKVGTSILSSSLLDFMN